MTTTGNKVNAGRPTDFLDAALLDAASLDAGITRNDPPKSLENIGEILENSCASIDARFLRLGYFAVFFKDRLLSWRKPSCTRRVFAGSL
jgi:hypothetical protein